LWRLSVYVGQTLAGIHPSAVFSSSLTTAGLAFPAIARIVWPTKKPNSLSLPPRYSATLSWLAERISAMAASMVRV
jgi:hypothetical protein